jgi:hypothetical protein
LCERENEGLRDERDLLRGDLKTVEDVLQEFDGDTPWQQAQAAVAAIDGLREAVRGADLEFAAYCVDGVSANNPDVDRDICKRVAMSLRALLAISLRDEQPKAEVGE